MSLGDVSRFFIPILRIDIQAGIAVSDQAVAIDAQPELGQLSGRGSAGAKIELDACVHHAGEFRLKSDMAVAFPEWCGEQEVVWEIGSGQAIQQKAAGSDVADIG